MEDLRKKLDEVNEDIGFLEEVMDRSLVEERIEELRLIRAVLERELEYDKTGTFETDSKDR
jgi:hypothetical protein